MGISPGGGTRFSNREKTDVYVIFLDRIVANGRTRRPQGEFPCAN